MAQVKKETIEKILEAIDIVELIGSYIPLKKAGTGYKACCPFHHEKTASFNVSVHKQFYHCFGCGASGDAITFVKEYEGLLFMDSVKKLAARAGVHIEEEEDNVATRSARKSKGRLLDLHRDASALFHEYLLKSDQCQHARDYLKSRGFGREMVERWQVGWMPENSRMFLDWVRSQKYTGKELIAAGIASLRDEQRPNAGLYVRFRDRLMFPIRNEVGDVIAFSGRQLKHDPNSGKYINSPETEIFKKSQVLFGLDRAKKSILKEKTVILCEGQIDAISCHENGISHAIAPLGTAFTAQHARILKRYAKTAVLCFDGDQAGMKASERAFRELVPEGFHVKVVNLPKGEDPDTFIKNHGADSFLEQIKSADHFFGFYIQIARSEGRLVSPEGRADMARSCSELLALMGDYDARDQQINAVASSLGLGSASLREGVARALKSMKAQARRQSKNETAQEEQVNPIEALPLHGTVAYLCQLALTSAPAQHFLNEQFETLREAKSYLEGMDLLEKILSSSPDTGSSTAVNAFILSLGPREQLALNVAMREVPTHVDEGLQSAEQALSMLSAIVLQKRDTAVKAALKEPNLSPQRMKELLEEAKEIASLLRWTGRSTFDDELAPETQKAPKKFFNYRKKDS